MKKNILLIALAFAVQLNAQNALNFDGTNDKVQTTFSGVVGTNNRTFEAWIYVDPAAPASNLCILDYGANAVGSRNTFAVSGTRKLTFTSGGTNANIGSTNTNVVTAGQWTHVAFVLNSGVGYLYVNGIQVGTGSLSTVNTPSGINNLTIGERVPGGSILFNGSIDEVRVWDVARTPTEIANNMNAEFCTLPTNLVAYYNFNHGVAGGNNGNLPLLDMVNNKNGVLQNFSNSGASSNWVNGATISLGMNKSRSVVNACDSFVSHLGNVYYSSGTYIDTVMNANNCDSIIAVTANISNTQYTYIVDSACGSYITFSQEVITSSGVYYDTLPGSGSCLWFVEYDLTITNIDTTVSKNGSALTSNENNGDIYRWLDCDNNYSPIGGASSQSFMASVDGSYAVTVTKNDCKDTSSCVEVIAIGIEDFNTEIDFEIIPNPARGLTFISIDNTEDFELALINANGQKFNAPYNIKNGGVDLDISGLESGLYLLIIRSEEGLKTGKLMVE